MAGQQLFRDLVNYLKLTIPGAQAFIFRIMAMAAILWFFLALCSVASVVGFHTNMPMNIHKFSELLKNSKTSTSLSPACTNPVLNLDRKNLFSFSRNSRAKISMTSTSTSTDQAKWNQFISLCCGSWNSLWSTYNYIGDVEDETIATVDLQVGENVVLHNHIIPLSSTTSNCDRCQDSFETRTIPVAQYVPGNLRRCSSQPSIPCLTIPPCISDHPYRWLDGKRCMRFLRCRNEPTSSSRLSA
jgi:hypothetical protein